MAPDCHKLTASLVYAAFSQGSGSSMTFSAAATSVSPGCGPGMVTDGCKTMLFQLLVPEASAGQEDR